MVNASERDDSFARISKDAPEVANRPNDHRDLADKDKRFADGK